MGVNLVGASGASYLRGSEGVGDGERPSGELFGALGELVQLQSVRTALESTEVTISVDSNVLAISGRVEWWFVWFGGGTSSRPNSSPADMSRTISR